MTDEGFSLRSLPPCPRRIPWAWGENTRGGPFFIEPNGLKLTGRTSGFSDRLFRQTVSPEAPVDAEAASVLEPASLLAVLQKPRKQCLEKNRYYVTGPSISLLEHKNTDYWQYQHAMRVFYMQHCLRGVFFPFAVACPPELLYVIKIYGVNIQGICWTNQFLSAI
jgi:hypothetical protein